MLFEFWLASFCGTQVHFGGKEKKKMEKIFFPPSQFIAEKQLLNSKSSVEVSALQDDFGSAAFFLFVSLFVSLF